MMRTIVVKPAVGVAIDGGAVAEVAVPELEKQAYLDQLGVETSPEIDKIDGKLISLFAHTKAENPVTSATIITNTNKNEVKKVLLRSFGEEVSFFDSRINGRHQHVLQVTASLETFIKIAGLSGVEKIY